jgi:signal transduction histidine kinase
VPAIVGVVLGTALVPIAAVADPIRSLADITPIELLFGLIPWGAGRALRAHRAQAAHLLELARELEHEREQRTRAAVAEERTRLARELHDVVAHSVSLIAVQADAAEVGLERNPEQALPPLRAIRSAARDALGELRRMLGLLRTSDADPALSPQPGLARIGPLVDEARGAGLAVELEVDQSLPALPPGLDLCAYRVVQEGLTNVRRHAGATHASVTVRGDDGVLDLEVRDDGIGPRSSAAAGYGLVGLRERVGLYRGELYAGAGAAGGFVLRARIPLEGADG